MDTKMQLIALRSLPAVNSILQSVEIKKMINDTNFQLMSDIVSKILNEKRNEILTTVNPDKINERDIINEVITYYKQLSSSNLKSVVNGTGIIIHTNLGRSKLSNDAVIAVHEAAINYSNLEYNLECGKRGSRHDIVEDLLIKITNAESAIVVNNNAAAVMLVLKEIAENKEVIVSRGQLIEIGGSFRVSEIMSQSGAVLKEIGTTNKTHLKDYEKAINDNSGLLMKVHTSNFKMIGFTKEVELKDLVQLGLKYRLPVYEDLGSGVLYDLKKHGIGNEPTVQEVVKAGIDIVSFSGDKLLGGPQAGIIVGKKKFIERIKKNQFARAVRVDKMTLAALEATLKHYLFNEAKEKIPTLQMIFLSYSELQQKSEQLINLLEPILTNKAKIQILDGYSEVGGGSLPDVKLKTKLIAIKPLKLSINNFEKKVRLNKPHIIGRISEEQFLLDTRTIEYDEFDLIVNKLKRLDW